MIGVLDSEFWLFLGLCYEAWPGCWWVAWLGDLCSRLLLWVVGVFWVVWLIMVDCLFWIGVW